MGKIFKVFYEDLNIFNTTEKILNFSLKGVSFFENIHIDVNKRQICIKFYREHKNYLYFVEINKDSIKIQKNHKESKNTYNFDYENIIKF